MSRRPGVALAQPEAAHEAVAFFIIGKLKAHALGIIFSAPKAKILLQPDVARVMAPAMPLLRHRQHSIVTILSFCRRNPVYISVCQSKRERWSRRNIHELCSPSKDSIVLTGCFLQ